MSAVSKGKERSLWRREVLSGAAAGPLRPPSHPCPPPDCDCSAAGTQGNACRKDPQVGHCVCKPNFQGTHCELCAPGFYSPGCQRESSPGPAASPRGAQEPDPSVTSSSLQPASAPALVWWTEPVTVTQASARAGQASRGPHVTAVPPATSTSPSASVSMAPPAGRREWGWVWAAGSGTRALSACSVWLQPRGDPPRGL